MAGVPKTVFFCCSLYQVDIHVKCLIFPRQFIILQLINNSINFRSKRTVNKHDWHVTLETYQKIDKSEISFKSLSGASTSLEWNDTLFMSTARSLFSFNSGDAPRTLV